jgi:hypothetical protein
MNLFITEQAPPPSIPMEANALYESGPALGYNDTHRSNPLYESANLHAHTSNPLYESTEKAYALHSLHFFGLL